MKKKFLYILPFTLLFACIKKKDAPESPADSFDKEAMLVNMADNVILPSYNSFKITLDSLILSYNTFKASGTLSDLQVVKQKLHTAYLTYQRADLFEFGPAENVIVRMNFNVFPTDTAQIKSNISSASYNLETASNLDAKGFPALDYLFYGKNKTEAAILQSFTSSPAQKQYVTDVLDNMFAKINSVINSWNGSYRSSFVSSLGTDVGSSIGFLVNQMNFQLDYIKNSKIGVPLGKKSLGIAIPDKCEAYYGAQSVQYAMESLKHLENVYLGRKLNSENGKGFDDYLDHIGADHNGTPLNSKIIAQFELAKAKLAAVPDPLSAQVVSNAGTVDAAYLELVKLLVLLKTDMPSQLGVVITYQDGDGD
jgi:predicted lipoprotein